MILEEKKDLGMCVFQKATVEMYEIYVTKQKLRILSN